MPTFAPIIGVKPGQVFIQAYHKVLPLFPGKHYYKAGLHHCGHLQARYKVGKVHCKEDAYLGYIQL